MDDNVGLVVVVVEVVVVVVVKGDKVDHTEATRCPVTASDDEMACDMDG